MTAPLTVAEVAEKLGVDRDAAYGLVRFLVAAKFAEPRGVRRPEDRGRGRGENVYVLDDQLAEEIGAMLQKLR